MAKRNKCPYTDCVDFQLYLPQVRWQQTLAMATTTPTLKGDQAIFITFLLYRVSPSLPQGFPAVIHHFLSSCLLAFLSDIFLVTIASPFAVSHDLLQTVVLFYQIHGSLTASLLAQALYPCPFPNRASMLSCQCQLLVSHITFLSAKALSP